MIKSYYTRDTRNSNWISIYKQYRQFDGKIGQFDEKLCQFNEKFRQFDEKIRQSAGNCRHFAGGGNQMLSANLRGLPNSGAPFAGFYCICDGIFVRECLYSSHCMCNSHIFSLLFFQILKVRRYYPSSMTF